jgi:hypothetical protein
MMRNGNPTLKQKSLLRFFARHFLFLKNILLQPSGPFFKFPSSED